MIRPQPFFATWQAQDQADLVEFGGGDGVFFRSGDGEPWLDLGSLSFQASLGHGHTRLTAAVVEQAQRFCVAPPGAVFPQKEQLAERLLALAPSGFSKVFFTLGGAEAVENALKMARLVTGRSKFLSRYRSYHGATFGALSLSGDYRRPPVEPGLGGVARVLRDEDIPETLEREGNVAAVVLEPIVGANGVLQTDRETWQTVRAACSQHGALLCIDEVLTGFGRTGSAFGFHHTGIEPDLICCAKALTGGYSPLGAVLVHDRVARVFDKQVLWAGLTQYGHPLGCAAGLAALDAYRDDGLFERAASLEAVLQAHLAALVSRWPHVFSAPRGKGLLAAVDVALNPSQWTRWNSELRNQRVHVHAYPRRGYLIVAPPLIISEVELAEGFQRVTRAMATALDQVPSSGDIG